MAQSGCIPASDFREDWRCDPRTLDTEEVRVRQIPCTEELISGGDGQRNDWLIENHWVRFVIRDAPMSLTRLDSAGGGIIDIAPPNGTDELIELLPLFDEEHVETSRIETLDDGTTGLRIVGITVSGLEVETILRLEANERHLRIEGPSSWSGLFAPGSQANHRSIELESDGEAFSLISDGTIRTDGAWLLLESPSLLTYGPRDEALALAFPDHEFVTGLSDGQWIEMRRGEETWARLPVMDGLYSGPIPHDIDRLVATATGHADGPATSVDNDAWVEVGEEGWIRIRLASESGEPLAGILFRDEETHSIPIGGGWIPVGPGTADTWVFAGPEFEARHWSNFEVTGEVELNLTLRPAITQSWLLRLGVPAWPDRSEPRSPEELAEALAGTGIDLAVYVADDEIADASVSMHPSADLIVQGGSRAASEHGSPFAWPWSATTKRPAHGAAPWVELDPLELLASQAKNGSRYTVVDREWVESAPPYWEWDPVPTALQILSPSDLNTVIELADNSVPIRVVGPLTWVDRPPDTENAETEIMARLLHGSPVASNGPRLSLLVNDASPGETLDLSRSPPFTDPLSITVEVQFPEWMPMDGISIIGPGGEILDTWVLDARNSPSFLVETQVPQRDWIAAYCWSEEANPPLQTEASWAFSGIVWVTRP